MSNGFRYYNRFSIANLQSSQWVLRIPSSVGCGILEFWSPNTVASWTVTQSEDGASANQQFRTGPASRSAIYLPRGGEVQGIPYAFSLSGVNEYNGFIERQAEQPELIARFYPELKKRSKNNTQRFVSCGALPFSDRPLLPGGVQTAICYPPHYAQTALVYADAPVDISVVDPTGIILQTKAITPAGAVPLVVQPYNYLLASTGPAPVNLNVQWSDSLAV